VSDERYNPRTAEIHWQQQWDRHNVFAAGDGDTAQLFHDPSGAIRLDHVRDYIIADVVARYRRARGCPGWHRIAHRRCREEGAQAASASVMLRSLGLAVDWRGATASGDAAVGSAVVRAGALDPAAMIDAYGADATRWFLLSEPPAGQDLKCTGGGLHGAWRFVHRLWRLVHSVAKFSAAAPASRPAAFSSGALKVRTPVYRTLARVSANLETSRWRACIADIHGLARVLGGMVADASGPATPDLKFAAREAADIMVQLFHPMMPHLAEECWAALGHGSLVATRSWPAFEAGPRLDGTVTLPVHVNGRKRAHVVVARDAGTGDIEVSVLALDVIKRALDGRVPSKVIIVQQRIINVVA
jgi:leucyl-tRNA synthetase